MTNKLIFALAATKRKVSKLEAELEAQSKLIPDKDWIVRYVTEYYNWWLKDQPWKSVELEVHGIFRFCCFVLGIQDDVIKLHLLNEIGQKLDIVDKLDKLANEVYKSPITDSELLGND